MGASFINRTISKNMKASEVKAMVNEWSERDGHEYGHSYSGSWAEAQGFSFDEQRTFETENDAYEFLIDKCQKWGPAVAVRFYDKNRAINILVGLWAAE